MNLDNLQNIIDNHANLSGPKTYLELKKLLKMKGSHAVVSSLVRAGVITAGEPKNPGQNLSLWEDDAIMSIGSVQQFRDLLAAQQAKADEAAERSAASAAAKEQKAAEAKAKAKAAAKGKAGKAKAK